MALLTRKEFGVKCGIKSGDLSNYIKRGKVLVENDRIDDAALINAAFVDKALANARKKPQKESENAVAPPAGDKPVATPKPKAKPPKPDGNSDRFTERFDLETEKKKAEIKKLARETETAELKHEKWIGKLIPTDMVKSLFVHTIKNYTRNFKQDAEKIVQEFAKRTKMNRNDMADMKSQLVLAINHASENSDLESKNGIKNIVMEYSEARDL